MNLRLHSPSKAADRAPRLDLPPPYTLVTLRESGDALFKDLTKGTKLRRPELTRALERLVALGFARKMKRKGETVYRDVDDGKD